jgi:hypothetical protein
MTIDLNNEEAQVLLNLIDVALKSAGLPAAEAALHFSKKIKDAAEAKNVEPTND